MFAGTDMESGVYDLFCLMRLLPINGHNVQSATEREARYAVKGKERRCLCLMGSIGRPIEPVPDQAHFE